MSALDLEEFPGNARFAIRHRLGAGAFGIVYEAFDQERKEVVALKVLRAASAEALYRFKQEFRALADLAHPNLISLYELVSEGERWFFTMERVRGVGFLEHVWDREEDGEPGPLDAPTGAWTASTSRIAEDSTLRGDGPEPPPRPWPVPAVVPANLERLRSTLRQLAAGITALHEAGKLHRDLKPSNVLVTAEGRVVILDFGLVTELDPHATLDSGSIVGTPTYMSPEQGAGQAITEASDWYAVGVMLFQALTGRVPFSGSFLEVVMNKRVRDAPAPREFLPGVPEDLDRLCRDLLHREPSARPPGRVVLRRLGDERAAVASAPLRGQPLVGREAHLQALDEAFRASRAGRATVAQVSGRSGVGKTALVRHFLEDLRQREDSVILTGRCYEQESVPYKALDSVVDALSRRLRRLRDHEVEALLPHDVQALERLFPVLKQVKAVSGAPRRVLEIPDPQELRRRAVSALRELLWRLAARQSLVLFIDDVHWGDLDSAVLLGDLLRPPDPPPLLLLLCYRSEQAEASPFLRALWPALLPAAAVREVPVGELGPAEAEELAIRLLGGTEPRARSLAETIARESQGNPFFIDELVRHAQAVGGPGPSGREAEATLAEAIRARVGRLPDEARRLLEAMAVAGQPRELAVLRRAAGISDERAALAALRGAHLVRTGGSRERDQVEAYHDRIRETVAASLAPESLPHHHARLAEALEESGRADPESLAVHFQAAGEKERAAGYGAAAAARAAEALAFDRAARLFRFALELTPGEGPASQALRVGLGEALANAGRGAEAARAYEEAAAGATAGEALELRRRVAEQLLISGHIDEGVQALGHVFRLLRMRLPATPRRALASLLLRRARIRLRGLAFDERPESSIPRDELIRIDTCWSVTAGLTFVDTIRGGEFQTRHLLLALRAGEPYRVARALALEAGHAALAGSRSRERTQALVARTRAIAERIGHPHALALATLAGGVAAYLEGRWRPALEKLDRAGEMFRDRCTGVTWERDNAQLYALRTLWFLGEVAELTRRLPAFLKDIEKRGDRYGATHVTRVSYLARLVEDAPAEALRELDLGIERWTRRGFLLQHFWDLIGRVETQLYAGEPEAAHRRLLEGWPAVRRSLLLRIQFSLVSALDLRARCALATAATGGGDAPRLLRRAEGDARRITGERLAWADALVRLIQAGVASVRGETRRAAEGLAAAEEASLEAEMALSAAAARRARGLLQGEDGLVADAEGWMAAQGIRNPERLGDVLVPGRWRRPGIRGMEG